MERPAWLKEEADRGYGFWRRHYELAVDAEDAHIEALLRKFESQFAEEQKGTPVWHSGGEFHRGR